MFYRGLSEVEGVCRALYGFCNSFCDGFPNARVVAEFPSSEIANG